MSPRDVLCLWCRAFEQNSETRLKIRGLSLRLLQGGARPQVREVDIDRLPPDLHDRDQRRPFDNLDLEATTRLTEELLEFVPLLPEGVPRHPCTLAKPELAAGDKGPPMGS